MQRSVFSTYHPAVAFCYFAAVIIGAFAFMQPIYVLLSFVGASALNIFYKGLRVYLRMLRVYAALIVVIAAFNLLFVQNGTTTLFTIAGRAFLAEPLVYGISAGLMLSSVFIWFSSYQVVMTNDKFLFLFARVAPATSLVISMIFRLIPNIIERGRVVADSQRAMLGDDADKKARFKSATRMASVLVGMGLEDCIDTADSMRARGYGSGKRTSFAAYEWNGDDRLAFAVLVLLIAVNLFLAVNAMLQFAFYPAVTRLNPLWWGYLPYIAMLVFPLLIELKGVRA